jgi:hypothetical protein
MSGADQALEDQLLEAHARGDPDALVALYVEAADGREAVDDIDAACFYLTHAFVFALQAGSDDTHALQLRLWEHGREERPHAESAPVDARR